MSELNEYYKVLGISEDATEEEIESAYLKLKEKYSKDRFLEGEVGNRAAKNLTNVETAYQEIKSHRQEDSEDSAKSISMEEVEELIKKGDFNGAQNKLDQFTNRDAEWHYMQSVIFYKKNWLNESKKQLEIAVGLDPQNEKYTNAYAKLKEKTEFNENTFRSNPNEANNHESRQMGGAGANDCCSFCATWCCIDMMCSICCR